MLEAAKLHSNFFSARLINSICLKIAEQDDTERFDERSDENFRFFTSAEKRGIIVSRVKSIKLSSSTFSG